MSDEFSFLSKVYMRAKVIFQEKRLGRICETTITRQIKSFNFRHAQFAVIWKAFLFDNYVGGKRWQFSVSTNILPLARRILSIICVDTMCKSFPTWHLESRKICDFTNVKLHFALEPCLATRTLRAVLEKTFDISAQFMDFLNFSSSSTIERRLSIIPVFRRRKIQFKQRECNVEFEYGLAKEISDCLLMSSPAKLRRNSEHKKSCKW